MQRNIGKSQFVLSGLCVALLTACGGGGDDMLLDKDGARPGFTGNDKSNVPLNPVGHNSITPPVNIFVTAKGIGQQTSPTVVAVDNNNNHKIDSSDKVGFNQPGIVSEFCAATECEGFSARAKKAEKFKKAMDEAEEKYISETDAAKKAEAKAEYENAVAAYVNSGLAGYAEAAEGDYVIMRDVNSNFHTIYERNTIDYPKISTGHKDAGIAKIDKKRTRTSAGKPVDRPYGGSTGTLFNKISLFSREAPPYQLDAYFRSSSAAGWSFQTFGYFFNDKGYNELGKMRNVHVGFQSVGSPAKAKELPTEGKATYRGISQAYFNDKQVTMENQIDANFSKRELTYTTTKPALYHTFEGPGGEGTTGDIHVIEERPDLNLTGHANWAKGVSKFQGEIHSGNGLHGTLQGQFYGPQAPEVGGVYGMQGTVDGQVVQYVGGFGAARD